MGIGPFFLDDGVDGLQCFFKKCPEGISPFGDVVSPKREGISGRKAFFMSGQCHGKNADPLSFEELNWLIERVEEKRVGTREGKVKNRGKRAAIKRGAYMKKVGEELSCLHGVFFFAADVAAPQAQWEEA